MSLLPINPQELSKVKYLLVQRVKDDTERQRLNELLGPFYMFRLYVQIRDTTTMDLFQITDFETLLQEDETKVPSITCKEEVKSSEKELSWDDIDVTRNMWTRAVNRLKNSVKLPCFIMVNVQAKKDGVKVEADGKETENSWSDIYQHQFPVNIEGMVN